MNSGQHLEPGVRIEGYRIESVLGQGGFGVTYLAVDESLDKRVAIKEYLPSDWAIRVDAQTVGPRSGSDRDDYEWGLERFLDEARALARFEHPHINRVHRHFSAHGTAYLVLEYIEGEPLSDRLRREGTLSPEVLHQLLAEMGSALAAVHKAGYVHRDIKPGNILLREDGRAVLVDFGAARQAVGSRSRNITQILTPGYAPIEQYDSKGTDIGPWTDVYALAVVAYRCVTGCGDADLVEANTRARKVFYGEPDPLVPAVKAARKGYPPALLGAIDQGLVIQERERPQDVGDWIGEAVKPDADAAPRTRPTEPPRHAASADAGVDDRGTGSPDDGRAGSASETRRGRPRTAMALLLLVAAVVAGAIAIPPLLSSENPWTSADAEGTAADADSSDAVAGTPEATTGRLVIRSNVRDDRASIDGEAVGPTGPEAHVLDAGQYHVRVEKQGFEYWSDTVTVQAGETTRVTAELSKDRPVSKDRTVSSSEALREAIENAPAGAVITLKAGRYKGPFTIESDVTLKGSGDRRDTVIESAGDSHTLDISSGVPTLHNLTVRYSGDSDSAVMVRGAASPKLDNVILELGGDGVSALYIKGTSRARVSRALVHASPAPAEAHGILIRDDARPRIVDTTVQGFSENAAIAVADRAAPIIEDSTVRDIESNGIYVLHQATGEYRRNHLESTTLAAISVVDTAEPVFADNRLEDLGSHAIQILDRAGGRFAGNRISQAGERSTPCVLIGADTRAEVIDNIVIDCRGPAFYSRPGTGSRLSGNRAD